jgi:hypothetical protein
MGEQRSDYRKLYTEYFHNSNYSPNIHMRLNQGSYEMLGLWLGWETP